MKQSIYLDYAAATPIDPSVLSAMQPYFSDRFYNPSATYDQARSVQNDLQAARSKVAGILGAKASEIIFTAGATEANNLVIRGVMEAFPDGHCIVSSIEHDSVLEPARLFAYAEAPVTPQGIIMLDTLQSLITDKTVLISVMYANNEVGSLQPLREIFKLVEGIRRTRRGEGNNRPLYVHTDAAQAGNYLDLHVDRLGVDFMTLNGGKLYGPKQSGVLYAKTGSRFRAQILGGGQERGWRGGTENVAAAIGLATALELSQKLRAAESDRLKKLQELFIDRAEQAVPGVIINGSVTSRLPNNVHLTIPGQDNERLLIGLDEAGVIAAAGSACSASNEEPSHVLTAMGMSDKLARASLRFSMGRGTSESDIARAIELLTTLIAR